MKQLWNALKDSKNHTESILHMAINYYFWLLADLRYIGLHYFYSFVFEMLPSPRSFFLFILYSFWFWFFIPVLCLPPPLQRTTLMCLMCFERTHTYSHTQVSHMHGVVIYTWIALSFRVPRPSSNMGVYPQDTKRSSHISIRFHRLGFSPTRLPPTPLQRSVASPWHYLCIWPTAYIQIGLMTSLCSINLF